MPLLGTRGAASARGFGQLSASVGTLETVTFSASGTWVAPPTVNNIVSLTAQGGSGTPAESYWQVVNTLPYVAYSFSLLTSDPVDVTPTYGEIDAYGDAIIASLNGSTAERDISYTAINFYYDPATQVTRSSPTTFSYRVRGVISRGIGGWGGPAADPVLGIGNGWQLAGERFFEFPATTGANTTAFGTTYPGGVAGPATPATNTNIPVTPGVSYPITVGSGGFVVLQYLA